MDSFNLNKISVDSFNLNKIPVGCFNPNKIPVDSFNINKIPVGSFNLNKIPVDSSRICQLQMDKSPSPWNKNRECSDYEIKLHPAHLRRLRKYLLYPLQKDTHPSLKNVSWAQH